MKCLLAACAAATLSLSAHAQTWPTKPIRIVIPFVAGGSSDIVGRAIGAKFQEVLGQQAVVENRPGANGAIAGISTGKPPACQTPRFTSSARCRKCVWQVLMSDQVLMIAITGLPA